MGSGPRRGTRWSRPPPPVSPSPRSSGPSGEQRPYTDPTSDHYDGSSSTTRPSPRDTRRSRSASHLAVTGYQGALGRCRALRGGVAHRARPHERQQALDVRCRGGRDGGNPGREMGHARQPAGEREPDGVSVRRSSEQRATGNRQQTKRPRMSCPRALSVRPSDCQTVRQVQPHSENPQTWHFTQPSAYSSCEPQSGHAPASVSCIPPSIICSPPRVTIVVTGSARRAAVPGSSSCWIPCFSCM